MIAYFSTSILIVCVTGFTAAADASDSALSFLTRRVGDALQRLRLFRDELLVGRQVVDHLLHQRRLEVLLLSDRLLAPSGTAR